MVDGEKITIAPDSPRPSRVVFMCDPSAEADRLQASLRGRGYPVVDVPLALLASRIRYEQPDLVVLDADAPNSTELTTDILNATAGRVRLILLGDSSGQANALAARFPAHALAFPRPVDVESATHTITSLLGPPVQPGPRSRIPRPPGLVAATRRPVRVDSLASFPPGPEPHQQHSEVPSRFPSLPPLPSDRASAARSRPAPSSRQPAERTGGLSAETRAILEQGRRKVRSSEAEAPRPYRLGPSSDAEIPESSPLLDLLEASLDAEEEPTTKVGGPLSHVSRSTPPFGYRAKSGPPAHEEVPPAVAEPRGTRDTKSGDTRTSDQVPSEGSGAEELTNPGGRGRPAAEDAEPSGLQPDSLDAPDRFLEEAGPSDDAPPSSLGPLLVGFGARPSPNKPDLGAEPRPEPPVTLPPPRAASPPRPRTQGREPALRTLAHAIRERASGALVQQGPQGLRRVILVEGDLLAVPSTCQVDALAQFLETEGHLKRENALRFRGQIASPRTTAAALVAEGLLSHDELLPVLSAHAEWILSSILRSEEPLRVDNSPPQRALEEPNAFGGRAGAHVFLDAFRRIVEPAQAFSLLGEGTLGLAPGSETRLLAEAKLDPHDPRLNRIWTGRELTDLAQREPKQVVILAGLVELGILTVGSPGAGEVASEQLSGSRGSGSAPGNRAFEERLDARLRLVKAGSYFSLLGLDEHATAYEVTRAHKNISDEFALDRLPPQQTGRVGDVKLVLRLAEEAFRVLSDDARRLRYRRALTKQNPR